MAPDLKQFKSMDYATELQSEFEMSLLCCPILVEISCSLNFVAKARTILKIFSEREGLKTCFSFR